MAEEHRVGLPPNRASHDVADAERAELNEAFYANLRDRYTIVIDWPDSERERELARSRDGKP